jgi:SAM-dependent methyltransferase
MNVHDAILRVSPWVERFEPLILQGGRILDLAAGSGRHSSFFLGCGYSVLAVDQDIAALSSIHHDQLEVRAVNLEGTEWPLQDELFSAIIVSNYLYRPYLDYLPSMLSAGGLLIYETFAVGNAQFGKPSNPHFLLNTGELLDLASRKHLKVLAYEDIFEKEPKAAMIQRICALKEH